MNASETISTLDAPFTFHLISLGQGGVAPCAQCARSAAAGAASAPTRESRPTEDILAEIEALPPEVRDVALGGFEPFAHAELPRLIAALVERGEQQRATERLLLQTDGGALASGGNAQGATQAGVRIFEIVYHAGDDDADDALTGRVGLARARQAGIAALHHLADADPDLHLMVCGAALLCRHGGRGAALAAIAQAAVRDGLDALRVCAQPGAAPDAAQVAAAAEILMPAGIWLFGDGCDTLLGGAAPYRFVAASYSSSTGGAPGSACPTHEQDPNASSDTVSTAAPEVGR